MLVRPATFEKLELFFYAYVALSALKSTIHRILGKGWFCQYSDRLQAGRPRNCGSIPGRGKIFSPPHPGSYPRTHQKTAVTFRGAGEPSPGGKAAGA